MKKHMSVLVLLIATVFSGCKSVQPVDSALNPIKIERSHRDITFGSIDLPAGVYVPDFQTKEGVYYEAPSKIVFNGLGLHRPAKGGLFIPHQSQSDQRQGVWRDDEQSGAGLIGMAATSVTRVWRFDDPVPFKEAKQ